MENCTAQLKTKYKKEKKTLYEQIEITMGQWPSGHTILLDKHLLNRVW